MSLPRQDFLTSFGWNDFFEAEFQSLQASELAGHLRARVIGEERGHYRVQLDFDRVLIATISGGLTYRAVNRFDYPAVGDWVLCQSVDTERAIISHVIKRRGTIARLQAGTSGEQQIIATNVDWMFIATSLNEEMNSKRLDRYIALATSSGAKPVILLTKADLVENADESMRRLQARHPDVPIHTISVLNPESRQALAPYVHLGSTSVIVGSSGVGKSTLVNGLLGQELLKTQHIREGDARGRHTTTARYLFAIPNGGLLIDTPGMREIQLASDDELIDESFSDVESLTEACRFGDCTHETEPGCAIRAALDVGDLDSERWESYQKLLKEARHLQRKQNKGVAAEDREKWKKIKREAKARGKARRGEF